MQTKIVSAFVFQSSKLLMKWDCLATQLCSRCIIHGFDEGGTVCAYVFSVDFLGVEFCGFLFVFFSSFLNFAVNCPRSVHFLNFSSNQSLKFTEWS